MELVVFVGVDKVEKSSSIRFVNGARSKGMFKRALFENRTKCSPFLHVRSCYRVLSASVGVTISIAII